MTNCPICHAEPERRGGYYGIMACESEYVCWYSCPKCGMCSEPEGGGAFSANTAVEDFAAANWEKLAAAVAEALKGGEA